VTYRRAKMKPSTPFGSQRHRCLRCVDRSPTNGAALATTDSTEPSTSRGEFVAFVACALIAFGALLLNVAAEPIDHGYTRYGSIAEHMVRTGDFIVPWLGDEIYVLKPPLQSWIIALPIAWLGYFPNWATHLPNLLGATASLVATWYLARRLLGSARFATLAALILATVSTFVEHSRGERVDPLFADSLVTALALFHAAVHDKRGRANRYVFATWLTLIVALYTKGPVGLAFFLVVAAPYAAWEGRARILISRASLAGFAIAIGAAVAWPIALVQRIGVERAREVFAAAEFAQKVESWWFYLRAIPEALVPWIVFLPLLIVFLRRERPWRRGDSLRLPILWIVVILTILFFSPAKAGRYLLPLLAPASILIAAAFQRAAAGAGELARVTGIVSAIGVAIVGLAMPFLPAALRGVPLNATPVALLAALLALVALRWFAQGRDPARGPIALGVSLLLLFAANDLTRARKLKKDDGRPEAIAALAPVLEHETVVSSAIPANDLGLIESIVRHELPRASKPRATGVVLTTESAASDRRFATMPGAARLAEFRLDEIDYEVWRLPTAAAQ
jgi:4-amino-4-deoxy-L-arabinose transferase-like glycosyltransferase